MSTANVEVKIFDTTLRDGAQSLPDEHQFPPGTKPEIANHIASLGVDVIEAGFPATPSDAEEVKEVAQTVGRQTYDVASWCNNDRAGSVVIPPVIAGLCRVVPPEIETTWEAVRDATRARIHTFISTDPEHMHAKFPGQSPEGVLAMGARAVRYAKALTDDHPNASVEFSAEAASTTDMDYLERVIKQAIYEGADIINVPDTVGQRDPFWMHNFYGKVIDWVMSANPNTTISAHNHNDLDQATANTLMLVRTAAAYASRHQRQVRVQLEATICGLGERAGNADVFPVVAGVSKFAPSMDTPIHWRFNPGRSVATANEVMQYAGLEVDRQSPVVGSDTNVHRSGIHSDGVIKGGHRIYTPHDPRFWGHDADAVHEDGKYQGRAGRQAALN